MGGDDEPQAAPETPPAPKSADDEKPDPTPMAEGGEVSFITVDETTYEVHIFKDVGSYTLSFGEPVPAESITADVRVVGGGGGAGGATQAQGANGGPSSIGDITVPGGGGGGAGYGGSVTETARQKGAGKDDGSGGGSGALVPRIAARPETPRALY
jgi:hypothetical protein